MFSCLIPDRNRHSRLKSCLSPAAVLKHKASAGLFGDVFHDIEAETGSVLPPAVSAPVEAAADVSASAAAAVAAVVNPEAFVIGGGVSKAGEILLKFVEPAFAKYVFYPCGKAQFKLATLGNDAGIFGAAALILK